MNHNPSDSETLVEMQRPHLENWPQYALPAGFSIRAYQSGDAQHWQSIHERADEFNQFDESTFATWFGDDETVLCVRQKYLIAPDGEVIGTATAWFDDAETGRVHWVAIVPEYQGRGLARPLLSVIGQTLRELGHSRAVLTTSRQRPVALALYEKFGFAISTK